MNDRNCFSIRARFGELFDGTLSAEAKQQIAEHLRRCPGCRKEKDSYNLGIRKIRALSEQSLPDGFAFTVLAKNRARRRLENSFRAVLSVAAVVLIVVFSGPGEAARGHKLFRAVHQPETRVDYIDASSMQPVELDYALHRAMETNGTVRLTPVVRVMDEHRRRIVEAAAFSELQKDLDRFGAAASDVEIEPPIEMNTGSLSPFVVAVETYPR